MITALMLATAMQYDTKPVERVKDFYSVTVKDIDGKDFAFKKLKGKVVIVVNTASFCGFTPQYKTLESLYTEQEKNGLAIIAFPANNFKNQEPHSNSEIKELCLKEYGVTFPLMSKISVKGDDMHPLYKWLVAQSPRPKDDIEWNFTKFILDRRGKVRYRILPNIEPSSDEFRKPVLELLAEPAP